MADLSDEEARKLGLDDHGDVDPVALGLEEAPVKKPVRTPGFFETWGDRLLRAAMPVPNSTLDAVDATARAAHQAGIRPSFSINRLPPTMPQEWYDKNVPGVVPNKAQMNKTIALTPSAGEEVKEEREAGGKANPIAAGLGNVMGTGVQLWANPLSRVPISGLMKTAPVAAEALGTVMPKVAANLLTKGLAGAGSGMIAQTAMGHQPDATGAALGAAGMIAPGLTGTGMALHGLLAPGLTPEQRATEAVGGGIPAIAGGMSAVNNMAPGLRSAADVNALRALGMKIGDIRKAGGLKGALQVGNRALKEKLINLFDKTEEIAPRALERRNEVGSEIAGNLDALNNQFTPELRAQMTPEALASGVESDVLPGLRNTAAKRPLMSSAQNIAENIRGLGDEPLSFAELNRQKAAYGDEAYKAANPFNPSPQASVLQDTYRSLNNQMENLGEQVSKAGGEQNFAQWLSNKARYGDLDKAYQSSAAASNRALSNRAISPSDYIVGAGGGLNPKSIAAGALNKLLRERGSSTLAVALDKAAQLAGKVPNPMRALTAPEPATLPPSLPGMPQLPSGTAVPQLPRGPIVTPEGVGIPPQRLLPSGPLPPQPIPGQPLLPRGPIVTPPPPEVPLGPRTAADAFPAPKPTGNPLVDRAEQMAYQRLFERLLKNQPMEGTDIVNPQTGEVLLNAADPDAFFHAGNVAQTLAERGIKAGPMFPEGTELPPVVSRPNSGVLEPLTPRMELIRRLMGEEPQSATVNQRSLAQTKKSPRKK